MAAGHDVTLFATADSITTATPARDRAGGLVRGCDDRCQGRRVPAHRLGVRARRRVRRHPQRVRLPASDVQRIWSRRRWSLRSTDSRRSGSFPSTSATTPPPRTCRSATPTGTRTCTTPPPFTTASTSTGSRSIRIPASICCSSDGSIPTRAPPTRSRSRADAAAGSTSPESSRTRSTSATRSRRTSTATKVRYLGAVDASARAEVLGGAHALLHLIDFDEPFGYSVVEAMACGTPVIANSRGSMGELIADGVTGFLVDDIDSAVAAVVGGRRARPGQDRRGRRRPVHRRRHGGQVRSDVYRDVMAESEVNGWPQRRRVVEVCRRLPDLSAQFRRLERRRGR